MTTTLNTTFRMTALAAALLAAYGSAFAQSNVDPDIARLISPSADDYVSAGVGNWSNNRAFQGQYDGMPDDGSYFLFDSQIHRRNDATGTWFKLDAHSLGLDTRDVRLGLERQGDMGGYLEYNQIPRKYPWTINTNLLGIGQTNMTIQGAPPTVERHLSTKRDRSSVGFYKNLDSLLPGLKFKADYRHEEKTGEINYGLGSQALFLVNPIDSTIQLLDAHLEYSKDKLQLRGGYYGTWYDTNNGILFGTRAGAPLGGTTQNPNPTPLSQPLNNQSWEVYLDGGYSFTPTTRATFKAKYGKATMDETLPSYSLTGINAPFVGMTSKLDGKVDTTLLQASLSSRPTPKLFVTASLRYYDMDDETPLLGVIGNNATGAVTVHNTPQSIKTTSGKLEAAYSLPQGFKVIGTIAGKDQDRSAPQFQNEIYVPYRTHLEEWDYGVQLRRGLSETINGSLGYIYSTRDGNSYTPTEGPESDTISPWHIADRNRDRWRLKLDWTPTDAFTLSGVVEDASDTYPHSSSRPYGMKKGTANLYSLDATYQINSDWQVVAFYAFDEQEAKRHFQSFTSPGILDANMKDKNDTLGVSLKGKVAAKWQVGGDVLWTKSRSSYNESFSGAGARYTTTAGVTATELPNIKTELTRFRLWTDYAVQKNASLRLDVIYEDWKTNDWSYSFANGSPFLFGSATGQQVDGTFFTQPSPQQSTFVGLRYKYMLD